MRNHRACCFAVWLLLIAAALPAGPTTRELITPPVNERPEQALLRFSKILDLLDPDANMLTFTNENDAEKKSAMAISLYSVALVRCDQAMSAHFGGSAGDDFEHAFAASTAADLAKATIKLEGDRAEFTVPESKQVVVLHLIDGKWLLRASEMQVQADEAAVNEQVRYENQCAERLTTVAAEIRAGKYASPIEAIRAAKDRIESP